MTTRARWLVAATTLAVAVACSSAALRYPACDRDDQCAVSGKHDYCVGGKCVYCRTGADCADRQRCRVGKCESDPDAPPPKPDAGSDADTDADTDEEDAAAPPAEEDDESPSARGRSSGSRSPPHVIPRGVRRFLRP